MFTGVSCAVFASNAFQRHRYEGTTLGVETKRAQISYCVAVIHFKHHLGKESYFGEAAPVLFIYLIVELRNFGCSWQL